MLRLITQGIVVLALGCAVLAWIGAAFLAKGFRQELDLSAAADLDALANKAYLAAASILPLPSGAAHEACVDEDGRLRATREPGPDGTWVAVPPDRIEAVLAALPGREERPAAWPFDCRPVVTTLRAVWTLRLGRAYELSGAFPNAAFCPQFAEEFRRLLLARAEGSPEALPVAGQPSVDCARGRLGTAPGSPTWRGIARGLWAS